jgi:hypothetical protein
VLEGGARRAVRDGAEAFAARAAREQRATGNVPANAVRTIDMVDARLRSLFSKLSITSRCHLRGMALDDPMVSTLSDV